MSVTICICSLLSSNNDKKKSGNALKEGKKRRGFKES